MRNKGIILFVVGLLVFIAGCGKVTKNPDNTKTIQASEKTVDYIQLSRSEKSEMNFSFTRKESDEYSTINMRVVNRTDENVKFIGNEFILSNPNNSDVTSTKDGSFVIKAHSTATVKNLFEGIDNEEFTTVGLFCYKTIKNKLAYSETGTLTFKSSNLTEANLKKSYQKNNDKEKTTITDNENTQTKEPESEDSTQPENNYESSNPIGSIINADQAVDLVESQNGAAPEGTQYSHMEDETSDGSGSVKDANGRMIFWVRLYQVGSSAGGDLDDWTVYPNGTVVHQQPNIMVNDGPDDDSDNDF